MHASTEGAAPSMRRRSKWPERLWMVLALAFVIAGAGTYGLRRLMGPLATDGVTHQIMPELEAVDYIEAGPGCLRDFNVLIITTDTTRADHVGCYGNRGVETPVIDQLAREGILCAQAITPSPSTLPGHCSLLTGLYPHRHGARANGTFRLEEQITTLAERLGGRGYRTGAVISAFVLDSRFGLDQGFEYYNDDLTKGVRYSPYMFRERPAELTNEPAAEWLDGNGREKFFMWVHYFDPHAAYLPPEPFRTEYARNLYNGEIAYADSQIGALLAKLEELGVRDNTLVIYTSDHGEGLGEHGEQTHSLLVYDATLHVPLIFSAPSRLPQGRVIHRQTSLVDVVPTVLALLGEDVSDELDGESLCEPVRKRPRSLVIETIASLTLHGWAPLLGIRRDDYKYIFAPTAELYDLTDDPGELENVHDAKPDIARELGTKLTEMLREDPFFAVERALALPDVEMDKEMLRGLAALGYVATVSDRDRLSKEHRLDPKEMIHHWEKLQKGINLRGQGKMREALPIIEECVAEVEGDIFARQVLASSYMQMGEYTKALEVHRHSVELEPNSEGLRLGIAAAHVALGELEEAETAIREALEIEPECAEAYILRGRVAQRRLEPEEALRLFEQAIEMDPGSAGPSAYNEIGFVHLRARRFDEARQAFEDAIRIDGLNGAAHDGLANILLIEGDMEQAERELAVALRFDPAQPRALATLAWILDDKGEREQALKLCERALEISPKFPHAHNNLGLIYRKQGQLELAEEHYRKAIEYAPYLDGPYVNLAQLYMRQGKTEEAIEQFELALRVNRYSPIAAENLGAYHFNRGQVEQALIYYRLALRADSDYVLAHKNIASIYAIKDQPRLTAYHLRRSLELDPNQLEAEQMRSLLKRAEQAAATRPAAGSLPTPPGAMQPTP